jgi:predicted exporter
MTQTRFDIVYNFFGRHRKAVCIGLFLLTAVSLFRTASIPFNNDVASMLPENPSVQQQLSFLQNSDMAGTVAFSINLAGSGPQSELLEGSAAFADDLGKISGITEVTSGIENINISKARRRVAELLPVLTNPSDHKAFDRFDSSEKIAGQIKQLFVMLTTPGSSFSQSAIQVDPAGWSNRIFDEINRMTGAMGYNVELAGSRFVDSTEKHALVVAGTSVPVTDAEGSRRLLKNLADLSGKYPKLDITAISGHKHTVSNEDVIKNDIRVAMTFVTLAFLLLMVTVFRSYEAILIFTSPFAAILAAAALASLFYNELSLFMMGFAAVITGIAVDYGIHAYTAFKTGGYEKLKQTAVLVRIASLTTIGVFVSFFTSSVRDYHQLAVFSIISLLLCVTVYLFIIPHFWTPAAFTSGGGPLSFAKRKIPPLPVLAGWLAVLVLCGISMTGLTFTTDLSSFDGSSREIREAEDRFHDIWGGRNTPGIAVMDVSDSRKSWMEYEQMSREIADNVESFTSPALVWPSRKQREQNLKAWNALWTPERINRIKSLVSRSASEYGFSEQAFAPFYEMLRAEGLTADVQMPEILHPFLDRYINKTDSKVQLLGYFHDNAETLEKVRPIADRYENAYIVSKNRLSETIFQSVLSDMKKVSLFSCAWVLGLILFFLRDIRRAALALVPAATAVPTVFGVLSLFHIQVTVVVLVTLIVILGLSIDYGVFLSGFSDAEERRPAVKAVTFSMLTTAAGTVGLLFASHPAMFVVGITMVSGVSAAYLSAMYCIPALKEVFSR